MYYDKTHSVTFTNQKTGESRNSWKDWYLIPSSRPVINPPALNTKYVSVPGSNTVLDLTDILTGYPSYAYREGSIEFWVDNGHDTWSNSYTQIMNFLHGQKVYLVLEDDPEYRYEGRVTVNSWKSEKTNSKITIDYYLYPFKKSITASYEQWLWDPFNFHSGVVRYYVDVPISGTITIVVVGSTLPVTPTVESSAAMTLVVEDRTFNLVTGSNKLYGLNLENRKYNFKFTGTGTITVKFSEECF